MLPAGEVAPYDVAIATSTYFAPYGNCVSGSYRLALFRKLIKSLQLLDTCEKKVCWVIHDDASPEFPEIPVMPFDVKILKRAQNIGQPDNYLSTVQDANTTAAWTMVCDDDGFVASDCLKRAFELVARHPEHEVFGLYNSPYHKPSQEFEDHVLKSSTCEHGRFFRSSFGGWGPVAHDIVVLRPSGIQHCGKFGLNGTEDDFDKELTIAR